MMLNLLNASNRILLALSERLHSTPSLLPTATVEDSQHARPFITHRTRRFAGYKKRLQAVMLAKGGVSKY